MIPLHCGCGRKLGEWEPPANGDGGVIIVRCKRHKPLARVRLHVPPLIGQLVGRVPLRFIGLGRRAS